jgi:hypothetical protein
LGAAVAYLLRASAPFTLVRGASGQGKSTLSQYLCQAHRTSFIAESDRPNSLPELDQPRFPIRLDLSDYALWLCGNDVWDHYEDGKQRRSPARKGEQAAIECFLADLMTHESGCPREVRKILTALCSDAGITILLSALERRDIIALPELPNLPDEDGLDPTWVRLTTSISKDPADSGNTQRVRVLRELLNQRSQFATWCCTQLSAAVGTPPKNVWLRIGAQCEAGAGTTPPFEHIDLSDGAAELFLSTGLVPPPGSSLEAALLDAVLDGECPAVTSTRSMPAQVAVALSPNDFLMSSKTGFVSSDEKTKRRRSEAINQLRRAGSPYAQIAKQRIFKVGQKGSTFPWAETAAALHTQVGRRWLVSEIAIIGAASPFPLAYTKNPGATPFGSTSHPSELLAKARANSRNAQWWRAQFDALGDDLARAEWALALWCAASGPVVTELLPALESRSASSPGPVATPCSEPPNRSPVTAG